MAETLSVKLVTPLSQLYDAAAKQVIATSSVGEFGLLPGHDPWMVALGMGPLTIVTPADKEERFFTNGGYCQVDNDNVVILAEVCERGNKIDVERALAAKQRAEERIAKAPQDPNIDVLRAEAALKRALYRLDIARG